ncbi:MAG: hemerythrin domain-containing protein, partial [Geobacteraceae bacterium]
AEEILMQESDYRGCASHIERHDEFVKSIQEYHTIFLSGDAGVITDTMIYLKDWLFDHILKYDRKYITLLIKKQMV